MKKILTILLCLVISASLFAAEDVRSMGMGGQHVTDYSDIYTIQKNPAGLGFADKHNLWLNLQLGASGPLKDFYELGTDLIENMPEDNDDNYDDDNYEDSYYDDNYNSGSYDDSYSGSYDENYNDVLTEEEQEQADAELDAVVEKLTDIIKKNNGLTTSIDALPLLNFGFIGKRGFGMLATTNMYADVKIPTVTNVDLNIGFTGDLQLGYGHKFDLGVNDIAVGVSGKVFANVLDLGITGKSLTEIMDLFAGEESSEDSSESTLNIPLTSTIGFGINAGVQYRFADFLNVGLVWNNVFSSTKTANYDLENEEQPISFDGEDVVKGKLTPTVALGVGIKVPINFIITSLTAYVDHENILDFFAGDKLVRNPILGFNAGVEAVVLKMISLRAGINESYVSAGVGLRLLAINVDFAVFGSELGLEPGARPQLNTALSISIKK